MNPSEVVQIIVVCFGCGVAVQLFAQLARRGQQ